MTEQPDTGAGGEPQPTDPHGHVRTDGEMSVDDALGAADDPQ